MNAAELAEGGEDQGAVAARGVAGAVGGGDFRQDATGDGFRDGEFEQAHGRGIVGGGWPVERGIAKDPLIFRLGKTILRPGGSRGMLGASKTDGATGQQEAG